MSACVYTRTMAGITKWGLEFDSEAELQEFCAARGIVLVNAEPPPPQTREPAEPRGPGRPATFDDIIRDAVESLGSALDGCENPTDAARLVQDEIERTRSSPERMPSTRTVSRWLLRSDKYGGQNSERRKVGAR